jgi:hypothetical protein
MKRTTYNRAYKTEGAAHLDIASWIASGELTMERDPRVEPYENREGKTRFKITVRALRPDPA